jgi:DNA-binding response OmpR family regulator
MPDTILIIDDDATLLSLISEYLEKAGYGAITAASGPAGLLAFHEHHADLVVLDVMIPRMDGWTICERLREFSEVPIIMLTAKGEERDLLRGFHLGVDDYIIKPFSFAELVARINAVLVRTRRNLSAASLQLVTCKDLKIDPVERRVTRNDLPVHLTPTEFHLLAILAEQPGRPFPPEVLLDRIWGGKPYDLENVKRYIHYLRQKLEEDPDNPKVILTERGYGYYLAK